MNTNPAAASPKRTSKLPRGLVILAVITGLAVVGATFAVWQDRQSVSAPDAEGLVFPDLANRLPEVDQIRITVPKGMQGVDEIVLKRPDDGGSWTVEALGGYPAKQEAVRKLLLGLSELKELDPRTADPQWHTALGLGAPEDLGRATRLTFETEDGKTVASLLVGRVPDQTLESGRGEGLIYVRRNDEDQTWLAKGSLPLFQDAKDWTAPEMLDLKPDNVQRVVLWAGSERPVILKRTAPNAPFAIANLPEGDVSRGGSVLTETALALPTSKFDTVVPANQLEFSPTLPVTMLNTFDGVEIVARLAAAGNKLWARFDVNVEVASNADEAARKKAEVAAKALKDRLSGWAYQLPTETTTAITQGMSQLVRSQGPADARPQPTAP